MITYYFVCSSFPPLLLCLFFQTEEDDYDADSLLSSQGDVGESFRHGARVMVSRRFAMHPTHPTARTKAVHACGDISIISHRM